MAAYNRSLEELLPNDVELKSLSWAEGLQRKDVDPWLDETECLGAFLAPDGRIEADSEEE